MTTEHATETKQMTRIRSDGTLELVLHLHDGEATRDLFRRCIKGDVRAIEALGTFIAPVIVEGVKMAEWVTFPTQDPLPVPDITCP